MPLGGAAALGIGALGSAIVGGVTSSQQLAAAQAAKQAALQNYLNINVPDPKQQQLILEQYKMTGQLSPEMEAAVNQGATAQNSINVNPNDQAAQESALSQLQDITANQGMDAQEKNQIQQGINQVNTNTQGATGAILQNAAARGVGGSGASLAAQLQAAQSGSNNASANAMNAQAQASQRALSALSQQGSLGGQLYGERYGQALNAANAQDSINQFNARNQQGVNAANTQATNQAQAYNTQEAQNIANQNTGLSNYQQQYNSQLQQQQYNNQLALAGGKANAENGVATQANTAAANNGQMWGNISGALATGAGSVYKGNQNPTTNIYTGTQPNNYANSAGEQEDEEDQ